MRDFKQRELSADDRITIPARITKVGELLEIKLIHGKSSGAVIQVPADAVLRAGPGDNNGLDDSLVDDVERHIKNLHDGVMASYADQRRAMEDEFQAAKAAHAARMAALAPPAEG
jgi:hypothetical protein